MRDKIPRKYKNIIFQVSVFLQGNKMANLKQNIDSGI